MYILKGHTIVTTLPTPGSCLVSARIRAAFLPFRRLFCRWLESGSSGQALTLLMMFSLSVAPDESRSRHAFQHFGHYFALLHEALQVELLCIISCVGSVVGVVSVARSQLSRSRVTPPSHFQAAVMAFLARAHSSAKSRRTSCHYVRKRYIQPAIAAKIQQLLRVPDDLWGSAPSLEDGTGSWSRYAAVGMRALLTRRTCHSTCQTVSLTCEDV